MLCPDAVFLPVDYEEYIRVSEKIKNILREFSSVKGNVTEPPLNSRQMI